MLKHEGGLTFVFLGRIWTLWQIAGSQTKNLMVEGKKNQHLIMVSKTSPNPNRVLSNQNKYKFLFNINKISTFNSYWKLGNWRWHICFKFSSLMCKQFFKTFFLIPTLGQILHKDFFWLTVCSLWLYLICSKKLEVFWGVGYHIALWWRTRGGFVSVSEAIQTNAQYAQVLQGIQKQTAVTTILLIKKITNHCKLIPYIYISNCFLCNNPLTLQCVYFHICTTVKSISHYHANEWH